MHEYMDIIALSNYLHVKRSTLYAWVEQGSLPHVKLGHLLRFRRDEIDQWIESQRSLPHKPRPVPQRKPSTQSLETIIARAKREVYTPHRGKPDQDRAGKEGDHGSV